MKSLLKKLFVTGLVACGMAVATNTTTYASEISVDKEKEIEIAKFGGFYSGISGSELNNPYHEEVQPELRQIYELFYVKGSFAKGNARFANETIYSLFEKAR